MMKKKKQSRSQSSSSMKNCQKILEEPSFDSSPSPRLLSAFRSKLTSGKDLKHMFRNMRKKPVPGLSSQARIVRCPNCQKLLQEPLNAPAYKCGQCDSVLQAKRWKLEGKAASNIDETDAVQINDNSIPQTLLSSEKRSYRTDDESGGSGSKSPMRRNRREFNSRASPSVERGYHSETVYKDEASNVRREWMRRADEFNVTGDSDVFASARSSPYHARSNGLDREWTQEEGRYENLPRAPFYSASPSLSSSAYEYGNSPYHRSYVSSSEQSYYHHQPNHFKQYGREGWFQESSVTSSVHYPGEISDGKYYQWSAQSSLHDLQYKNLYESSSSLAGTSHRSVNSEMFYQATAAALPLSPYSEQRYPIRNSKIETSSEKGFLKGTNRYIKEKNHLVKRHVLPSGGAAPFATCNYCLELLQLPQGSSQGKHKRFLVRCGSCSGVLKFSLQEKAVHDKPSLLDSSTGFPEETIDYKHQDDQDSASEGHEEICPDQGSLSFSENDSRDTFYNSTDAVILSLKDNQRLREQQCESSETTGETSRFHLERSQEVQSEKSTEIINNIRERDGRNLEESGYERYGILKAGKMAGDGSGEPLEVTKYKKERMRESIEEAETLEERSVFHSAKALNKDEYVYETRALARDTRETHKSDWEETQEIEEHGRERTWEKIMRDKQKLHLEGSQYCGSPVSDSNSSIAEVVCSKTFQDIAAKEDRDHISSKFSETMSAKPQSPLKSLADENQRFIEQPDQSSEARIVISRIQEEQSSNVKSEHSQYEYENSGERQELDKTVSDQVRYELEECRYETNETLEPGKVVEDGSDFFLDKVSDETTIESMTGEERPVSHRIEPQNKNVENSCGTPEPVYLEGSVYAGERAWAETMEDRAGLHLEEYERNYEDYIKPFEWNSERAPTFRLHVHELGEKFEPEEDADGRSESSSFNDHDSSNERAVLHESQDTKSEFENSSERKEFNKIIFERVRSELEECRHETNEILEPGKVVGDESVVCPEKTSDTIIGERGENRLVSHQMESQNGNVEEPCRTLESAYLEGKGYISERSWAETTGERDSLQLEGTVGKNEDYSRSFEWTSERAPTFHLHEYQVGEMLEPDEDADERFESSSMGYLKERAVFHEEEPRLVDEALKVGIMEEDEPLLYLGKNEAMKLEETFEWTSERAPTFRLHEYESGTMLEPDEDVDDRSESSSRGFNTNESLKEIEMFQGEEPRLVDDRKTKELEVRKMSEDVPPLNLEGCKNQSMKLNETFDWTSERALTFRLQEYELGTMLEPEEDTDDVSESSSRGSFNYHGKSKESAVIHENQPELVDDNKIKSLEVGEMAEDGPSLNLEKCKTESMKLEETSEGTSETTPTSCLHEYEPRTMLKQGKDTDERSESNSRGPFNYHGNSREKAIIHETEPRLMDDSKTEAIKVGVLAEDGSSLHLEKCEKETMEMEGKFEWTAERALTFRLQVYELEKTLELDDDTDGRSELYSSRISFNNHGSPKERVKIHEEDPQLVSDTKTEAVKLSTMEKDGRSLHLEKCENETKELDETLEPRNDIFRLSLDDTIEQESMIFHSEISQDKQENLRQALELGKAEEDIPTSSSRLFSEDHDSSIKIEELDSEADKERPREHSEYVQKKNEKLELTCEPYAQFYSTTEPSEIVGLRHALYQTQSSPLRSPLTSPIHTPIGSPLHYLMSAQVRSPIASPMSSHIVSPLRSPITSSSSGSLSDVLFFGKKD